MAKIINGVIIKDFLRGFWGDNSADEGRELMSWLDLDDDKLPFDIEDYLQTRHTIFQDGDGKNVEISFTSTDSYYEFVAHYKGHKKVHRLYREWEGEDLKMIIHLESEGIGDATCMVIHNFF